MCLIRCANWDGCKDWGRKTMCGIVGYVGKKAAADVLYQGLKCLEYRGYDSAGLALAGNGGFKVIKAVGKLENLGEALAADGQNSAGAGIGHIRWATHGKANLENAHPHLSNDGKTVLVHNGIIENYKELRQALADKGYVFISDTDTEVIVQQIEEDLKTAADFAAALRKTVARLKGAFALAIMHSGNPGKIYAVRRGAPLVVGLGRDGCSAASDVTALAGIATQTVCPDDDEVAVISADGAVFTDVSGAVAAKTPKPLNLAPEALSKRGFAHFMLKEINEQPGIVRRMLQKCLRPEGVVLPGLELGREAVRRLAKIEVAACGTSLHAATVGKYIIEDLAGVTVEVEAASEYIYRRHPQCDNVLVIGVSQSGETADTITAVRQAKERGAHVLAVTNREESGIVRYADSVIALEAGVEVSVAATKSYTAQLTVFYLLALYLAQERGTMRADDLEQMIRALQAVPVQMEEILADTGAVQKCAEKYRQANGFIYVARGVNVATAMEGALKLKELSYINASGYPAGELKHGPIALLDEKMPVLSVLMPGSPNYDKLLSNSQEAKARNARMIAVTSAAAEKLHGVFDDILHVPEIPELLSPLTANMPLQLLAYYMAEKLGRDVDKPRNLAKSVTVE